MKLRYRLFKRGEFYYSEDALSRKQHSLHTNDPIEAQRLIAAKNEAINGAQFTLAIGQAYLAVSVLSEAGTIADALKLESSLNGLPSLTIDHWRVC